MNLTEQLTALSRKLPQINEKWRGRLARNAWWIALILAILMTLVLLFAGALIFFFFRYLIVDSYASLTVDQRAFVTTVSGLNAIQFVVTAILLWASVKPLKRQSMQGWRMLYIVSLITVFMEVVFPIFTIVFAYILFKGDGASYGLGDVLSFAFWSFVYLYILHIVLQIRGRFSEHR